MIERYWYFFLLLVFSGCLRADDDLVEPANYAFANYMGSGVYRASGRQVSVLNLPISYQPSGQTGPTIMRWRLPLSVGFFDFDFDDIGGGDLPGSAETLSFVPGVEWDIPITDSLMFVPYVDLGWGINMTSGDDVLIYSAGISSHYQFGEQRQHQWVNRLFYAGYRGLSVDVEDGYASLQSGIDWRLPLDFSLLQHESFVSVYGLLQWHFSNIEFIAPQRQQTTVENNIELGVTLGFQQALDLTFFDLQSVGLGYRVGDGLRIWRLSFNSPI